MSRRIFSIEDQLIFAELSGDYNPLHVDPNIARRMLYGSAVVHGVHALLWALDEYFSRNDSEVEFTSIKAVFTKPIFLEEEVRILELNDSGESNFRMKLLSGDVVLANIEFRTQVAKKYIPFQVANISPKRLQPRDLKFDDIENQSGDLSLKLNSKSAKKLFPFLFKCVPLLQISVLLASTRLVGSICPGLHSLYSELDLTLSNQNTKFSYKVAKIDKRFNLIVMDVKAPGMKGVVKAFYRPVPVKQLGFTAHKKIIEKGEFRGQFALVVGGSRGLGEVAAKLLAAGGANVMITYYKGMDEAKRIVDDIVSNNGIADCFAFDVLNRDVDSIENILKNWKPTHLYYFATPFIFSGVKGMFSAEKFSKFCEYYVSGFDRTIEAFKSQELKNIFYPSSVALNEIQPNMKEYTIAKAAGESMCIVLGKSMPDVKIYKPRLPRSATDQTVSLTPVNNQDPIVLMLNELRNFCSM